MDFLTPCLLHASKKGVYQMAKKTSKKTAGDDLFAGIKANDEGKKRPLNDDEKSALIAMFAIKEKPKAMGISGLAPGGSFVQRLLRHFDDTDISYALPLSQLIALSSSWLTQSGAQLEIPGFGFQRPILWTVALARSAQSKTTSVNRVGKILAPKGCKFPVAMFPTGGTDAQWIVDLKENNGSFWLQDEVGKFFSNVLKHSSYLRIKPWMLNAYSHEPISNRLKSEANKLEIDDPHFTFFGLSVREIWKNDVDAGSMLDGFCQRFNYVIAEPRADTDMFDHFLYFVGDSVEAREERLRELWEALCNQEGAASTYTLNEEVMPYLQEWWRSLRSSWGNGALPFSFIRRIGFSVLSYLVVIHFLLGKSTHRIDVETAGVASKYAEFHLESGLEMMREYGDRSMDHVRCVIRKRDNLIAKGKAGSARDIQGSLSKSERAEISNDMTKRILEALEKVDLQKDIFEGPLATPKQKSNALVRHKNEIEERLALNERKRNERRLRNLLKAHRSAVVKVNSDGDCEGPEFDLVDISTRIERAA